MGAGVSVTIEEFIAARLDEDKAAAEAATAAPWSYNPAKQWHDGDDFVNLANGQEFVAYGGPSPFVGCIAITGDADDPQSMADAAHIARHDPASELRRIAALRHMIEVARAANTPPCGYYRSEPDRVLWDDLGPIAAIWREHPQFRGEWLPTAQP